MRNCVRSQRLRAWQEGLAPALRSRQAGAARARNRHAPCIRCGSERAVHTHLTTTRHVSLATPRANDLRFGCKALAGHRGTFEVARSMNFPMQAEDRRALKKVTDALSGAVRSPLAGMDVATEPHGWVTACPASGEDTARSNGPAFKQRHQSLKRLRELASSSTRTNAYAPHDPANSPDLAR